MTISNTVPISSSPLPNILLMTLAEFRRLKAEIEELASGLWHARMAAQEEHVSGESRTPTVLAAGDLFLRERRLSALRSALDTMEIVDADGRAVIGTLVTVRYDADDEETYRLVVPGEGDPKSNTVSPDSPLGAALLGRCAGDEVTIATPAGSSTVLIVSVEAVPA